MPKIDISYVVLHTSEGEYYHTGGILYHNDIPVLYEYDDAKIEWKSMLNHEIDTQDSNNSWVTVRHMTVWED